MKTQSKEKIEKANRLFKVVEQRKSLEAEEKELKTWAKAAAEDGFLEAGDILIAIENREREMLDLEALQKKHGAEFVKKFLIVTGYQQVNVTKRGAK